MAGEVNNNRVSTALTVVKENAIPVLSAAAKQVGPIVRKTDALIDKIAPFNPPAVVNPSDRRTHAIASVAYAVGAIASWFPLVNIATDGAIAAMGFKDRNHADGHRNSAAALARQTGCTALGSSTVLGYFAFSAPQNTAIYGRACWYSVKQAFLSNGQN